jgi:hypothetical protein
MDIPKVVIYAYSYSPYKFKYFRLFDYAFPVEPGAIQFGYYTVVCTISQKSANPYQIMSIPKSIADVEAPIRSIAYPIAISCLKKACMYIPRFYQHRYLDHVNTAREFINKYQDEFDLFLKKKFAKNIYEYFYYCPKTNFCQHRLLREFKELSSMTLGNLS